MTILHLSDTHSKHYSLIELPPADIIIHSGDVSFAGSETEVINFIEWFGSLPYKYKIFIAGNHDDCLFGVNMEGLPENCFYLCNSGITIEGMKFYGVPMFTEEAISGDYDKNIQKIPNDTHVLITHQPPYCILDSSANINYGDRNLLQMVLKIQPKYHLFGHIHDAYGIKKNENTSFVNAAILNERYEISNKPVLLEICKERKLRLLFVCTINKMRSATAHEIYKNDTRFEVKSAGTDKTADTVLTDKILNWADSIIVMERSHRNYIRKHFPEIYKNKKIVCLYIPDDYNYMQTELIEILKEKVEDVFRKDLI